MEILFLINFYHSLFTLSVFVDQNWLRINFIWCTIWMFWLNNFTSRFFEYFFWNLSYVSHCQLIDTNWIKYTGFLCTPLSLSLSFSLSHFLHPKRTHKSACSYIIRTNEWDRTQTVFDFPTANRWAKHGCKSGTVFVHHTYKMGDAGQAVLGVGACCVCVCVLEWEVGVSWDK